MSALAMIFGERAKADIIALAPELRPAVLEHLTRIATNHTTSSRPSSFPHPPGMVSGLWIRKAMSATLLEVLFHLGIDADAIAVRRVLITECERLPDWVRQPDEWGESDPWPVVDI